MTDCSIQLGRLQLDVGVPYCTPPPLDAEVCICLVPWHPSATRLGFNSDDYRDRRNPRKTSEIANWRREGVQLFSTSGWLPLPDCACAALFNRRISRSSPRNLPQMPFFNSGTKCGYETCRNQSSVRPEKTSAAQVGGW